MRIAFPIAALPLILCFYAAAQPLASVSGTVVDLSTGAPLENIRVRVVPVSDTLPSVEYTAVSDREGRFSILGIPPGRYGARPHVPPRRFFVPILGDNGRAASDLFLRSGDHVENLRLQIARPAVITGRVVGDDGEPVAFARVGAELAVQQNPPIVARGGFGQSDERGMYRLVGSPGKYKILVEPAKEDSTYEGDLRADGEDFQYGPTYFPHETQVEKAGIVEALPDGETTGVEIRMTHAPAATNHVGDGKNAMAEGTVVDSVTGKPLSHARVTFGLFNMDAPGRAYYATSRADGTYRVTGLPAGRYTAFASRPSYLGGSIMLPSFVRELKDGEHATLDLQLAPEGVISGRVVAEIDIIAAGFLVEATGAPREKGFEMMFGGHMGMSITDDRGEFRIHGLAGDRYRIRASVDRRGLPSANVDDSSEIDYGPTYYRGTLDESAAEWVELPAGGEVNGLEIRSVRIPNLHVKGRLTREGGAQYPARLQLLTLNGQLVTETWLAADGTFVFWHMLPGQYQILGYRGAPSHELRSAPLRIEIKDSSIDGIELAISAEVDARKQKL